MNRQLKFRVWNSEDKSWDNPAILEVWDESGKLEPYSYIKTGKLNPLYQPIENYIIQQWTGLLDKSGKEIYEGDIVFRESYQAEYIVKFENFRYLIEDVVCHGTKDAYRTDMISELSADLMIIGNIFENKDLLL